MFQATRRRLAFWYAGITALLLVLFASVVYGYVRTTLVERVDDTLNHVVEVVQRSLVIENAPSPLATSSAATEVPLLLRVNVDDSFRQDSNAVSNAVEDDHIDLEWFDDQGTLVWSTLEQPLTIPLHVNPYGETVRLSPDHLLRQMTRRVMVGDHLLGYLRVSHPWFEVTAPSQKLMVDLAAAIVGIVATVASVGWFLSGLAMEPVQDSYQKLKQFTADASHELRNPIAVIQTNAQVALADPEPDVQFQQEQFQVIERITRRLGRLVDDLLFLARQDSGIAQLEANPVSLGGLLVEVVSDQRAIATEKGVRLTFECPSESPSESPRAASDDSRDENGDTDQGDRPPSETLQHPSRASTNGNTSPLFVVRGDRDQLTRLFTNLISNAIQYTPPEGQVTVSLHPSTSAEPRPSHPRTSPKEWAIIRIRDSGIGIAPEEIPHIFDRFYRIDRARSASTPKPAPSPHPLSPQVSVASRDSEPAPPRKPASNTTGAGLGLAIAKTIVDIHQGHITVESFPQGGTTFTVRLPLTH